MKPVFLFSSIRLKGMERTIPFINTPIFSQQPYYRMLYQRIINIMG